MWNLKINDTNELTYKTERDREWTYGCWGKGWLTDFGIDMYTLLYLKWIINKDLLYNTWNSDQCYMAACMGENRYMYIYGWVPSLFTWNYHNIVNQLCLCPCEVTLGHLWLFAGFNSTHLLSHLQLFVTPWTAAANQASLSIINSWSLFKLVSSELVMLSNHLILCCPFLLLISSFLRIRVFSNESVLRIRCPKYWSFSFNISPCNEYSGLIYFTIDWFDLLAIQWTLKSLL